MRIAGLLIMILFLGCQDIKVPEKPVNLIPKDKMVDILVDTYLGNSARSIDNRLIIDKGVKLDSFIYTKYAIDSTQFEKSNAYYSINLSGYADLYKKVEERLVALQKGTKKENDSTSKENKEGIEPKLLVSPPEIQDETDSSNK